MVTEEEILEIRRPRNTGIWGDRANIVFALPIISLLRIRFSSERRSILLYFKENRTEAIEYMISDCTEVAKVIQKVLERNGFFGKHRSAAMEKARKFGLELCSEISLKQSALGRSPTFEQVQEIINLHCLAAEKLEYARDDRYSEVISHMSRFLAKPKISRVLKHMSEVKASALLKIKFSNDSTSAPSDISSLTSYTQSVSSSRSQDDQSGHSLAELLDHDGKGYEDSENYPVSETFEVEDNEKSLKEPSRLRVRATGRNLTIPDDRVPFQRRIII